MPRTHIDPAKYARLGLSASGRDMATGEQGGMMSRYLTRSLLVGLVTAATLTISATAQAGISALPKYKAYEIISPQPQANPGSPPSPFGSNFGERRRTIGDTDGDGVKEALIADVNFKVGGNAGQGRLWIFDPRRRRFLRTFDDPIPQAGARFGFWSAALGNTGEFVTSA